MKADDRDGIDVSWVRHARDAETLAGRGVKAWILLSPDAQGQLESTGAGSSPQRPRREQRVLIGNRKLMSDEGIAISR